MFDTENASVGELSFEEAARYLGVSTRTVRNYVRSGLLVPRTRGRRKFLVGNEVESLCTELRTVGQPLRRSEVVDLRSRLLRVEAHVDVLLRLLDARMEPLRMGAAYAKELYEAATGQLRRVTWDLSEITPWTEVFLRVDEQDLETIAKAVDDSRPWRTFLRLCLSMSTALVAAPEYATSLTHQTTHRQLAEGRRRLRISALCHMELHGSTDRDVQTHILSDVPLSVRDTLERVLRKQPGRTRAG